ncbi:MAG: hypothetical protein NC307_07050 [Roseburia sp.]|nr:hypothetical protein [Roseburia sp.]
MMEMKKTQKKWLSQSNLIQLAVIMLTAYILSALLIFQTYNPDKILDQGRVCDFSSEDCTRDGEGIRYDFREHAYEITEDHGALTFPQMDPSVEWRYLYIKAEIPSGGSIPIEILYYNKDNSVFASQQEELTEGENYITMASGKGCKTMVFTVDGQKGRRFSLNEMQIRYKLPKSGKRLFLLTLAMGGLLWCVWKLCLQIITANKAGGRAGELKSCFPLKLLTWIHQKLGMDAYERLKTTSFYHHRENKRKILFILLFLGIMVGNQQQFYTQRGMYKYCVLFSLIIFLLLTLLLLEGKDSKQVFSGRLANIWFCFWIMACISDFLAPKFYKFTGWVMICVMGMFFYWWRQMEKPEKIWLEALDALRYLFYPVVVYCLLFRPKTGGVMYNGFCRNPQEFAVYALLMFAIFLLHLFWNVHCKKVVLFDGAGAVICFYYLLAAGDYYCIALALAYGLGSTIYNRRKLLREKAPVYLSMAIAAVLLSAGMHAGTRFLPGILGKEVVYDNERKETHKDGDILRQLKTIDDENYGDVKKQNVQDRILIWKAYGRKLNVQGNGEKSLSLWGEREYCRNGALEIMFRYGIYSVIPYLFLLFYMGGKVIISCGKDKPLSFEKQWESVIVSGFILLNLLESVEIPFGSIAWVLFYMSLGYHAGE